MNPPATAPSVTGAQPPSTAPAPQPRPTTPPRDASTPARPEDTGRDWIADAGIIIVALAAIVSSAHALAGLATMAGWADLAMLLPAMVDAYGITATRVWLSKRTRSRHVRRYAAGNAIAAITLSVVGNAVYHAVQAKAVHVPMWALVVAVSIVPPITIGLLSHLVALRSADAAHAAAEAEQTATDTGEQTGQTAPVADQPSTAPATPKPAAPKPSRKAITTRRRSTSDRQKQTAATRPVRTDEELLTEARDLDRKHRDEHDRPISAQTLADTMHIGKPKANALVKTVRSEHDSDQAAPLSVVR